MPPDPRDAGASEPSRMLATARQRFMAAAAAATVLLIGYMARPEEPVAARLEERPGPLLQEAVEQRTPQTLFQGLQRVGTNSLPYMARVDPIVRPAEFWSDVAAGAGVPGERHGVVVSPGEILAEGTDLEVGEEVTVEVGDGRHVRGVVVAHFPDRTLALIAADTSSPLAVPQAAAEVTPGEAVVAVGLGVEGPIVAPLFVAGAATTGILTATPLDAFRGMGVFDEAGALVGIVATAGDRPRILPLEAALAPVPFREPPPPRLGVSLAAVLPAETPGSRAVSVVEVAPDGPAAWTGLRPGDILLDDSGQPIPAIESATILLLDALTEGAPVRILRDGREIRLQPPAGEPDAR